MKLVGKFWLILNFIKSGRLRFMEYIRSFLDDFELIKTFVISLTMLITIILFCLSYIRSHLEEFKGNAQDEKKGNKNS